MRTCAATGAKLHLIKPLGFKIDEKAVKRSGMDYIDMAIVTEYKNLDDFFEKNPDGNFYLATTKAKKTYSEMEYKKPCYIIFGKESKGLPEDLIETHMENSLRIPMVEDARSLNLSNSVAIVLYEALKQHNFENLKSFGELTKGV